MDRGTHLVYGGLAMLLAFAWWTHTYNYELEEAWRGFSPIGYVYQSAEPDLYARNYPSGTESYDASAIMHGYKLAYRAGIPPETMLQIAIALEIILLAVVVVLFVRTLRPNAPPVVAALVVILVVASDARDMNLARYSQPFIGQFYNAADILRLLAIVAILRRRPVVSAACLAGAFVVHPSLGLLGAAFVGAAMLVRPREIASLRVVAGAALFVTVSAAWTAGIAGLGAAESFPVDDWIAITRMGNYHWYPVDYGLFTTHHQERFLAFLVLVALGLRYAGRNPLREVDRRVLAGCAAMAVLVVVGLVASRVAPWPSLIKLSLHRGSDLIILVMLAYVADGLCREIAKGGWRAGVAVLVLLSPLLMQPGFPVLIGLPLLLPPKGSSLAQAGTGLGIATLLLIEGYALAGIAGPWTSHAYTGIAPVLVAGWPAVAGVVVAFIVAALTRQTGPRPVIVLVVVMAMLWLWQNRTFPGETEAAQARAYLDAQLWVRDNTPRDTLVMPDPTRYYGWRDYSHRSSVGNLREWLHTGWLYKWDPQVYREGLRRFAEFGIDLRPYLRHKPPISGMHALTAHVRRRYYTFDEAWYLHMADKYDLDYFVHLKPYVQRRLQLPIAFENQGVILYAAPSSRDVRRDPQGP